jgi:ATP-dependent helicase/DNAse subunit B
MRALAQSARELAESAHRKGAPLAGERGAAGTPLVAAELRAGVVAAELLDELAEVATIPGCRPPDLAEAIEAIEGASVRAWQGPSEGRVRIISPYRMRSLPLTHLFVASLQEGDFPGSRALDPQLGEERRSALGIAALRRREQADEERYLFHACVSRPTRKLHLSWRSCDDEGATLARSPFVDEVLDLVAPDPAAAEDRLTRSRGLENAVVAPSEAPTPRELARALAARRIAAADVAAAVSVPAPVAAEVGELLAAVPDPRALPGPLALPAVLDELGGREVVSASSLENWLGCSYRWFVGHELKPEGLEPTADPLWLGGVVHRALSRLYADPPGADALPRPGDVDAWKRRFGELLDEESGAGGELAAGGPRRATGLARAREQVEAFLDEEAQCEMAVRPRPDLLERGFGMDGENDPGALPLAEGIDLRGMIDRIDVHPDGRSAVVRDYKLSRSVTSAAKFEEEGKLQVPLYMLAARDRLDLDPIAGLYHPLGSPDDRRPRGMALDDPRLDGVPLVRQSADLMDEDRFAETLERARAKAVDVAEAMRRGAIARDPLGGTCPRYCTFQTICRLERAVGLEEENNGGGGGGS